MTDKKDPPTRNAPYFAPASEREFVERVAIAEAEHQGVWPPGWGTDAAEIAEAAGLGSYGSPEPVSPLYETIDRLEEDMRHGRQLLRALSLTVILLAIGETLLAITR